MIMVQGTSNKPQNGIKLFHNLLSYGFGLRFGASGFLPEPAIEIMHSGLLGGGQ